jgi:hypothetical protein
MGEPAIYKPPPDVDPPETWCPTSWVGEWQLGSSWNTSMPRDAEGIAVWIREYLEHDGHEDCCHHTHIASVLAIEASAGVPEETK